MSYFEDDNNSINGSESGSDSGSDADSDAGSYNPLVKTKPKSVISLEEEEDNGSEIADSEMGDDDEDEEDDDLAEGREDDEDDDEDIEEESKRGVKEGIVEDAEEEIVVSKKTKKVKIDAPKKATVAYQLDEEEDEEDDDDETGELYLKKFDKEVNDNYLLNFHPECALHNYDEVLAMTKVVRDKHGIIVDDLHKTIPFLTKYERARILGQRAKQINSGGSIFVKVPENVLDGYLIAELELLEKRIPFIIRRPLPNGGSEYWSIKDLENIAF